MKEYMKGNLKEYMEGYKKKKILECKVLVLCCFIQSIMSSV